MRSFAVAICLLALVPFRASGADCPVQGTEQKLKTIASAAGCKEAVDLFKLCAIGSSSDARLAVPVLAICEKHFLSKLTAERRKAYAAAIEKCNAQYAKRQGTMYRSMAASCRVNMTYKYSKSH